MHQSPWGRFVHRYIHLMILAAAVVSLGILTPTVRGVLYRQFDDVRSTITQSLSEQLGRPFSYDRLSPSVFRRVEIHGLEIDGPRGETLRIDRALASYSIFAIVTGRVTEVIDRLIIERAFLEIDYTEDREFLRNVRQNLFGRGLFPEGLIVSLREVEIRFITEQQTVALTNIGGELELRNPEIFADIQSRVLLDLHGETEAQLESQVAVQLSTERGFQRLDGQIALGRLFGTHLVVDPLAFDVSKSGSSWSVTKQQDAQPFDVRLDVSEGETRVSIEMDEFVPGDIIAPGPPAADIEPWLGARLTGTGEVTLRTGGLVNYQVDLDALLPGEALPEPLAVSIRAGGDTEQVDVEEFRAVTAGSGVAEFSGRVALEPLTATGRARLRRFRYAALPELSGSVELSGSAGRQRFSSAVLRISDTAIYHLSGTLGLDRLLTEDTDPAEFEVALSLSPDRSGMLRASGSLGSEGVVALDGEVEEVSLDQLLATAASYDPRLARFADSVPEGRYQVDTRFRLRRDEEGLFFRAPFLSLYDTEDFTTYLSLNLTYDRGTLLLEDLLAGAAGYEGSGELFARVGSGGTVDFELDLEVEGIAYALRGLYTPGDSFVFSGDHSVDGRVYTRRNGEVLFTLRGREIPIPLRDGTGDLTFRLDGLYAGPESWQVRLRQAQLSGTTFLLTGSPGRLELAATADPTGITLDSISYEDPVSTLGGKGSIKWNSLVPPVFALNARLESRQGGERYELSGRYEEGEISSTIDAVRVPFPRLGASGLRGGVDLGLRATGSLGSPRVSFTVESNEAGIATEELTFSANGVYTTEETRLRALELAYSTYQLSVEEAVLNREEEVAEATFSVANNAQNRERTLEGRLNLDYQLPQFREAPILDELNLSGSLSLRGFQPLSASDSGERGIAIAYSSNELRLSNWYRGGLDFYYNRESGEFSGSARDPLTVRAAVSGVLENGEIAATVTGIEVSMPALLDRLPVESNFFNAGDLTGAIRIVGPLRDPSLFGTLRLEGGRLTVDPLGETIGPVTTSVILDDKNIRTPRTVVPIGSGEATVEIQVLLNRLSLEGYRIALAVSQEKAIPVDGLIGPVTADGFASGELTISGDTVGARIEGSVTAQSVRLAVQPASERPERNREQDRSIALDLDIISGRGVQFVWPNTDFPIIRSNLATQQVVSIAANSRENTFSMDGEVEMQSGDIYYFDRNFYIREGEILFDEDQDSFDPRITVRAELREATPEGPVRIFLVADTNPLSEFSPRFESSPPLSTAEIVGILGGNIFAQSPEGQVDFSSALLSTSDILTQFGVVREFEDNVRNALNLDLFSIRTQIFQNIVASAIEDGQTVEEEQQRVATQEAFPSLGSYLNNTSIFMGRYLGDELFLEMLVQLQADPAQTIQAQRENDIQSLGGVLIDPEIRLEWQTPFFLLEWNFAPKNPEELFVRDNTFTFSWGFSY